MIHILFLLALTLGFQSFAAGFSCETNEGLEIVIQHTVPRPGRPVKHTRLVIREGGNVLVDRSGQEIQRYREGKTFNFLVKGSENFPVAVASLQIEFPGYREYLGEREWAEGSFRIREGSQWKEMSAECHGQDWDLDEGV